MRCCRWCETCGESKLVSIAGEQPGFSATGCAGCGLAADNGKKESEPFSRRRTARWVSVVGANVSVRASVSQGVAGTLGRGMFGLALFGAVVTVVVV